MKVNWCFSDRKGVPFVALPFLIILANYIFLAIQGFRGQPLEEMFYKLLFNASAEIVKLTPPASVKHPF